VLRLLDAVATWVLASIAAFAGILGIVLLFGAVAYLFTLCS
jgi:hypothetical protein